MSPASVNLWRPLCLDEFQVGIDFPVGGVIEIIIPLLALDRQEMIDHRLPDCLGQIGICFESAKPLAHRIRYDIVGFGLGETFARLGIRDWVIFRIAEQAGL